MESNEKQKPDSIPSFLKKVLQDKKDIKQALKNKKPLRDLAKEKGINFARLL